MSVLPTNRESISPCDDLWPMQNAIATSGAGRNLTAAGSDDERSRVWPAHPQRRANAAEFRSRSGHRRETAPPPRRRRARVPCCRREAPRNPSCQSCESRTSAIPNIGSNCLQPLRFRVVIQRCMTGLQSVGRLNHELSSFGLRSSPNLTRNNPIAVILNSSNPCRNRLMFVLP